MSINPDTTEQPTWKDIIFAVVPELPEAFSSRQLIRQVLGRFPELCLRTPKVDEVIIATADSVFSDYQESRKRSPKKVTD